MKVKDLIHFIKDNSEDEIKFTLNGIDLDTRFITVDPDQGTTTILLVIQEGNSAE